MEDGLGPVGQAICLFALAVLLFALVMLPTKVESESRYNNQEVIVLRVYDHPPFDPLKAGQPQ